ncbi:conserved hypothetical protein [Ricinus communis]|uniref:Uncharacterized protein n=1 Tax=Ricinus communis TaxID=3988 RepID=B9TNV7_RICCO|nr:conserved hypothetical protein [Ricinus communis]
MSVSQLEYCCIRNRILGAVGLETEEILVRHLARQPGQQVAHMLADQLPGAVKPQQFCTTFVGHMDIAAPVADQETVAQAVDRADIALLDFILHRVHQAEHGQHLEDARANKPDYIRFRIQAQGGNHIKSAAQYQCQTQPAIAFIHAD